MSARPWKLIEGDVLDVLPTLRPRSFDLLLADPPYSSGGMVRGDRLHADPNKKYSKQRGGLRILGDTRDQLQWVTWCGTWLRAAVRLLVPGAIVGVFVDWRQIAALYAAFGVAGLVLRGVVVWHKQCGRPQPGRPRQECEFVVWGTVGPRARDGTWLPGHFSEPVTAKERTIFCAKPVDLMRQLVQWCPEKAQVLDLFAGSGSTAAAAVLEGRRVVSIDNSAPNIEHCHQRLTGLHQAPTHTPQRARRRI